LLGYLFGFPKDTKTEIVVQIKTKRRMNSVIPPAIARTLAFASL